MSAHERSSGLIDFQLERHQQNPASSSTSRPISPMADKPRPASQQRPIDEAVSNAFSTADTSSYVPPELIAQITQNVIKQLQNTGLDGATPVQAHQQFPPPPPTAPPQSAAQEHHPAPASPSTASAPSPSLPNRVLTPPSPHRHSDYLDPTSPSASASHAPEPVSSPAKGQKSATFSPIRPSSPMSQTSNVSDGHGDKASRPRGPDRLHTGMEETTLEKIWGPLFDENSQPTARLSQFLRGLAVHIIEDCEPRHSLVVTPNKMVKYYNDVKLDNELYPWSIVFDDERSSISRMYRELSCQHHLVQEHFDQRPDIPGLTPGGFEHWVTLLIRAHPEREYERLAKSLLHMPINNPDDKKERFPKEITRRLFPKHADMDIRYLVQDAMEEHASIEIPRSRQQSPENEKQRQESPSNKSSPETSMPPPSRPSVSFAEPEVIAEPKPSYVPSNAERERAPYSSVSDSTVTTDDLNPPQPRQSKPIERERKPYVAQEGTGRQYVAEDVRQREGSTRPRSDSTSGNDPRPSRTDSTARARPIPINPNGHQIPKPEIHQHHRGTPDAANSHRRRSPSFSHGSDHRRPDGERYRPSFEPGSLSRSGPAEGALDESDTKRYFENQARDRARRKAEEDARAYGDSPRRAHDHLKPRRGDYGTEEEYWRARERRERAYDDGHYGSYR